MANFKVLPLPAFVERTGSNHKFFTDSMEEMGYIPMKPIFNRDGWYYDRKKKFAWFEFDGRAWDGKHCTWMFLNEMQQLDTKVLSRAERNAIETLIAYKTCPKQLKELLFRDTNNKLLNDMERSVKSFVNRLIAETD